MVSSARIRQAIFPENPDETPYEVLDYRGVLVLHDSRGRRATFLRQQKILIAQEGVSAILDHMWGTGVVLADYRNTAGSIGDSFADSGRRHLMIKLKRPMHRGQVLDFAVRRLAMASFGFNECWLETAIDHPVLKLSQMIVFPKARPCQIAWLQLDDGSFEIPVAVRADGRTVIRFELPHPGINPLYLVRWLW